MMSLREKIFGVERLHRWGQLRQENINGNIDQICPDGLTAPALYNQTNIDVSLLDTRTSAIRTFILELLLVRCQSDQFCWSRNTYQPAQSAVQSVLTAEQWSLRSPGSLESLSPSILTPQQCNAMQVEAKLSLADTKTDYQTLRYLLWLISSGSGTWQEKNILLFSLITFTVGTPADWARCDSPVCWA